MNDRFYIILKKKKHLDLWSWKTSKKSLKSRVMESHGILYDRKSTNPVTV